MVSSSYAADSSSSNTSGHFLLVNELSLFSRVSINRKAPVKFERLATHLHSVGFNQSIQFLYSEAL